MDETYSHKVRMWYYESINDKSLAFRALSHLKDRLRKGPCRDFALYPRRFYKCVERYKSKKTIDYCFIGGYRTDKKTELNRKWIIEFIKSKFTDSSYLQFTDTATMHNYKSMGSFDYTLKEKGFVPKEHPVKQRNYFDEKYFKTLSRSKFCLCPAGDQLWSMRFYEALLCKSIPIVNTQQETFRSEAEAKLDYKYYLTNEQHVYREDWALHNYEIFLRYHTLEYRMLP